MAAGECVSGTVCRYEPRGICVGALLEFWGGDLMTMRGKIKNGVVVLENGAVLPDGTSVTVRAVKKPSAKRPGKQNGRRKLLRHAGKATGLPTDAARNLDHYLYGHAKQ
jgi:hypothetical protein